MIALSSFLAKALVAFPYALRVAEPADEPGGPPKRFERATRIPETHGIVRDGMPVALGPSDNSTVAEQFPQFDIAQLSLLATASSLAETFDMVQPLMEASLDALSFQMQAALHVVSFEILDVTPPLSIGEDREWQVHAAADAGLAPKFSQLPPDFTWNEYPIDTPDLRAGPIPGDTRQRMALWWYIKGLDAPYAVDKFTSFWTSLEILWSASDIKVEAAYTTTCGHAVDSCPVCGRLVARTVRGPSIKRFLTEEAEVGGDDAAGLWNLRQVVHGKNVFDAKQIESLGRLASVLRAAVHRLLKRSFGERPDQRPLLSPAQGLILGNRMSLGGYRPVGDQDVAIVDYLRALAR